MKKWIAVLLVIPFCPALLDASGCRAVIRHNYVAPVVSYQAAVVKQAAVVYPVVATYVVPLYGATYVAPVPAPVEKVKPEEDTIRQVVEALKQIDARLQKLEGRPVMPPAGNGGDRPPPPGDPFNPQALRQADQAFHLLVKTDCASCHDKGSADSKGNGFVMTDGDRLIQFTDKQRAEIAARCYDNDPGYRMPKNKPALTDEKVAVVMQWLKSVK